MKACPVKEKRFHANTLAAQDVEGLTPFDMAKELDRQDILGLLAGGQ